MENQDSQQTGPRLNISNSKRIKFLAISLVFFSIIGSIVIFTRNKSQEENQKTGVTISPPSPVIERPAIVGWSTYEAGSITFDYPVDYEIEEREKGFFAIVKNSNEASGESEITIDTRRQGVNSNYKEAIGNARSNLSQQVEKEIPNGIKMYGKVKEGLGKGISVLSVYLQYGQGALVIESSGEILNEAVFDQVVNSIKTN